MKLMERYQKAVDELLEKVRECKGDEVADNLIFTVLKNTETEKYYTDGHWLGDVVSLNWEDYERMLQEILRILAENT